MKKILGKYLVVSLILAGSAFSQDFSRLEKITESLNSIASNLEQNQQSILQMEVQTAILQAEIDMIGSTVSEYRAAILAMAPQAIEALKETAKIPEGSKVRNAELTIAVMVPMELTAVMEEKVMVKEAKSQGVNEDEYFGRAKYLVTYIQKQKDNFAESLKKSEAERFLLFSQLLNRFGRLNFGNHSPEATSDVLEMMTALSESLGVEGLF